MAGLVLPRKERKALRKEEAIERNAAYQKMISTPDGITKYISGTNNIGHKQMNYLIERKQKLVLTTKKSPANK